VTVTILTGDVRDRLRTLEPESVQMCVTSPPYWGLRSYLPPGHPNKHLEIGLEPSVDAWVRTIVDVFAELRRVLRKDGTLWLNLGDSYAGARDPKGKHSNYITGKKNLNAEAQQLIKSRRRDKHMIPRSDISSPGFKTKDVHGQPWRLAFALQGFAVISCKTITQWADLLHEAREAYDWSMVELVEQRLRAWDFTESLKDKGWYLRQEIIWAKNNPMPESMRDRCTKAHEHLFLLSRSPRYYFDADAIKERSSPDSHARMARARSPESKHNGAALVPGKTPQSTTQARAGVNPKAQGRYNGNGVGFGHGYDRNSQVGPAESDRMGRGPGWRAKQNESFSAAVVETVEYRNKRSVWTFPTHGFKGAHFATFPPALVEPCILAGSRPGDTVIDIFGGSGTTGLVADQHQRNAILIDLDERNEGMAAERIRAPAPLLAEVIT
jgi:site-specific DNA-methyltransferase (cytosine-N4-specific)